MAIATGAHSTYDEDDIGNREDLSDVIFDVSPLDTPFLSMMGRTKATAVTHEWLTDVIEAAADNKALEGGDATGVAVDPRVRRNNTCQILDKVPVVTGTQEEADSAGVKSEMAYQVARRMKAIKRDLEFAMIGQSNAKVTGAAATAREMASFDAYLTTNNQLATESSAPTGDGTDVSDFAGVDRDLSETILTAGLQSLYTNSGGNSSVNMLLTAAQKAKFSAMTANATRYVTNDQKELVSSVDVYVGDFHTVKAVPDRQLQSGISFIVDPEYVKLAELRKLHSYDLAKQGDSHRKQLIWECTLEVCNEKAHVLIGDLNQ